MTRIFKLICHVGALLALLAGGPIGFISPAFAGDSGTSSANLGDLAIEYAQKNFGKVHFQNINIKDYASAHEQADIVYCSNVIEKLVDPESFIAEAKKLLAPGGILYLSTPDGNHFMIPSNFPNWKRVSPPDHIVFFSKKGLKTLLERNGLKVEKFQFSLRPQIRALVKHI